MDDIDKKLADNESAYIQGLITLDEYKTNCKEYLSQGMIGHVPNQFNQKNFKATAYKKEVQHDKD